MWQYGNGSRNNNGSRLIDVCQTFQLVIGGPSSIIHKFTWTSPSGRTCNQVDHICVSRKWRGSLLDVKNRQGADIDSDHELITGDIKIKLKCSKKKYTPRRHKRLNVQLLRDRATKKETTSAFREKLLTNHNNTEWEATNATLRQIAQEKLGTIKTTNSKLWISDTTWGIN
ncbi:craniofacial development protein 2-like [Anastrepha obliqua]|uniref:craniofacial development protein 2-like n=1 Tax=Anastrepha obliqua TaxID=95512 RepID=UPI00240A1805|nr:craniofacial development protein 2-like [Anastrepha obliqua]